MKTSRLFAISLGLTLAAGITLAWLKVRELAAGRLLLDYLFLPLGLFLFLDAAIGFFRNDRYFVTRYCRLLISVIFLALHVQMLLAR